MKRIAETNVFSPAQNNCKRKPMDFENRPRKPVFIPTDLIHLGGDIFAGVNQFLGLTRVNIRRYVVNEDGEYQPTKDGVSLSPKIWHSLCGDLKSILRHKSPEKVFVIEKDLCISKQLKDGVTVFVLQRLFQRKNCSMQFVPEFVALRGPEFAKLFDSVSEITKQLKEGLITYSLAYFIQKELDNPNVQLDTTENTSDYLEFSESLCKCLCVSITLKITELTKCFGCHDFFDEDFMHDCISTTRSEKWSAFFEQALYLIDMKDVASDVVKKNLNLDFNYVLGQLEYFDALDVEGFFKSVEKMYIGEEQANYDDLIIACN